MSKKAAGCAHPPHRLYAGATYDPGTHANRIWVACCDCGALLQNAFSQKTVTELTAQGVAL